MSKRSRTRSGEEVELAPIAKEVLETYEGVLAQYMHSLPEMLSRYNKLLEVALPHNPRSSMYAYDLGSIETAPTDAPDAPPASPGLQAKSAPPSPLLKGSGTSPPNAKRPTSPLLRRPSIDPKVLEEINQQASDFTKLMTPEGSFVFPKANLPSPNKASEKAETPDSTALPAADVPAVVAVPAPTTVAAVPPQDGINPRRAKMNRNLTVVAPGNEAKTSEEKATPPPLRKTVTEHLKDVECSPMLLAQLRVVRKESQAFVNILDQIHDWIAMRVPAMKEEDNSGVMVMAEVMELISSVSTQVTARLHNIEQSFIGDRAKMELEYLANPGCETTRNLLRSIDDDKWNDIEEGYRSLMRGAIIIHGRLAKNMKHIRSPREKRNMMSL